MRGSCSRRLWGRSPLLLVLVGGIFIGRGFAGARATEATSVSGFGNAPPAAGSAKATAPSPDATACCIPGSCSKAASTSADCGGIRSGSEARGQATVSSSAAADSITKSTGRRARGEAAEAVLGSRDDWTIRRAEGRVPDGPLSFLEAGSDELDLVVGAAAPRGVLAQQRVQQVLDFSEDRRFVGDDQDGLRNDGRL